MKIKTFNERKEYMLPPRWCSLICRNSMNEVCVKDCAIQRDAIWFELREGITLETLPRFPLTDFADGEMTAKERQTCVAVYLTKITDHLQGVRDDRQDFSISRINTQFEGEKGQYPISSRK